MRMMKELRCRVLPVLCAALALFVFSSSAFAQQLPPLPAPLQNMVDEGAQIRYLGQQNGLDGWIAIKGGQEQYFYVTADGQAFVMGLLFDKDGKIVTLRQVQKLQESSEGETLDLFALGQTPPNPAAAGATQAEPGDKVNREFKTPSEQLFSDVEASNWIALGNETAPFIYVFVDPECPHCKGFMNDLRHAYIDSGQVQVRIVPVGLNDTTRAQAAFLLAVPSPQKRWYDHLDGDTAALPINPDINQQGVQRNMAVMQSWKINATPFTVYRSKKGEVKIIQGRPKDIKKIMEDIH